MSGTVYNHWGWDVLVRIILPVALLGILGIGSLRFLGRRGTVT
jgi:hypothetical protein